MNDIELDSLSTVLSFQQFLLLSMGTKGFFPTIHVSGARSIKKRGTIQNDLIS